MEQILKKEMRNVAIELREQLELTQEQMSEELFMSLRSYSDIECGITLSGSLTTILLLMKMSDPGAFLQGLRLKFEELLIEESFV